MDLNSIRKIYDEYSLFCVVTDMGWKLESIIDIMGSWRHDRKLIIIPSLCMGGYISSISELWKDWNYDEILLQKEIGKGMLNNTTPLNNSILKEEIIKHSNMITQYSYIYQDDRNNKIGSKIIKNLKYTLDPRLPIKKEINYVPNEKTCAECLMGVRIFSYPNNSNKNIMDYIMEQSPIFISNVLAYYGIDSIDGTIDIFYNLAFLLNTYKNAIIHDKEDVSFLSSLNIDQLISLTINIKKIGTIGHNYKAYPWGHAYLLYGVLTGCFIREYNNITNEPGFYNSLIQMEPYKIVALKYGSLSAENLYVPPYQYVDRRYDANNQIFQLMSSLKINEINVLIDKYGIVVPPNITDIYQKLYYFIKTLKYYDIIMSRHDNLPELPDSLEELTMEDVEDLFGFYTDRELLTKYPIKDIWHNRYNLYELIWENYRGSVWRLSTDHCINDDTFNVLDGNLHGDIDKDNEEDPTFSYGTWNNYRCYQASELEASFYEDDEGFHFNIPDYVDPRLNRPGSTIKEFPPKSMRQLLQLIIETYEDEPNPLVEKIKFGLDKINLIQQELGTSINTYESFIEEEKQWATVYLVWLFLFSMWMRFWKGPNNEYPYVTRSTEYCSPEIRDEHVILQLYVRDAILDNSSHKVREWIYSLPIIKFDWKHPEIIDVKALGTLERMLLNVQDGKECQGIAGDVLSASAYGLIKYMFDYDVNEFNRLINQWTPFVDKLEKEIIMRQLPYIATNKLDIYNQRLIQLNTFNLAQSPFDPTQMEYTQHVNSI